MTHVPETGAGKMESIYGAGFWSVCHVYKTGQKSRVDCGKYLDVLPEIFTFQSSGVRLKLRRTRLQRICTPPLVYINYKVFLSKIIKINKILIDSRKMWVLSVTLCTSIYNTAH